MKIKAILFDLDGVLIDATEWHYEALNRALGLFGYNITRYEHLTSYDGIPTTKKLQMLSVEKGLPKGLHKLIYQIKQKYTREEILTQCTPIFEKEFMVHQLKRDGYRMAVCSNSIRESVYLMLNASGILDLFDFYISNEDVKVSKPDPEMYLEAFRRLDIKPNEAVIIEDNMHGVEAARRSGGHVCHVKGFNEVDYQRIKGFIHDLEKGATHVR